jgi:hypothetical protein
MLIALVITIAAISCVSGLLIVSKAGEKENLCDYDYIENN